MTKPADKKIYVMVNEVAVKIGVSENPPKRAQAITSIVGSKTRVVYEQDVSDAFAVERWAHHLLMPACIAREWFDVSLDEAKRAVDYAQDIVAGTADNDNFGPIRKDAKCACCKPTPVLAKLWVQQLLDAKFRRVTDYEFAQEIADEILGRLDHYITWSGNNYESRRQEVISNIKDKYGSPIDPIKQRRRNRR